MADFYDPRRFDPHESLGYLVGHIRRALLEALEREIAPLGLTAPQAIVLFQLQLAEGAVSHAAEFCRVLHYDPGAMTRLLDRLEKKGFVRRVRSERDRRALKLELTAAGRAAIPRMWASAAAVFNRFLHGFNRSETRQLIDFLKRLRANAER